MAKARILKAWPNFKVCFCHLKASQANCKPVKEDIEPRRKWANWWKTCQTYSTTKKEYLFLQNRTHKQATGPTRNLQPNKTTIFTFLTSYRSILIELQWPRWVKPTQISTCATTSVKTKSANSTPTLILLLKPKKPNFRSLKDLATQLRSRRRGTRTKS